MRRSSKSFLDAGLGLGGHAFAFAGSDEGDSGLDEVADHAFDVAADVADLGELGGFDLDEGSADEAGQAAGDLGLADAGGADHEDVLGHDLGAQLGRKLLSAPAVTDGDGDSAFGGILSHDIAVELGDDLSGGQLGHVRKLLAVDSPSGGWGKRLDADFGVGVDVDAGGDGERLPDDLSGGEFGVFRAVRGRRPWRSCRRSRRTGCRRWAG